MAALTAAEAKHMARKACFFILPDGTYLRMHHCDEDHFVASNEDSGEDYQIEYDSGIDLNDGFTGFMELKEMTRPTAKELHHGS